MGSTSKGHKLPKALNIKQDEDRISNLPDTLIGHILCFLPTKDAVATSVLSTKWKDLWTFTTRLEFDDGLLRKAPFDRASPHLQTSFMNFVDRVLLLCESPNKFYFKCHGLLDYDVCRVNAWIASVLKHDNIQELDLSISMWLYARVPGDLFRKETLVELKLVCRCVMDIGQSVWLPRLKVLEIDTARFLNGDSLTNLLSGCPLLGNLILALCFGKGVNVINIRAPVLTSLKLQSVCCWEEDHWFFHGIKIVFETPMLSDLVIEDFLYECYEFTNLNHLKKAHICLECPSTDNSFPRDYNHSKSVDDILKAVSAVHTLELSGSSMEAIDWYQSRLPVFQHLSKLILSSSPCAYWKMLRLYLEKSPHLKTLIFKDGLQFPGRHRTCSCCGLNYFRPPDAVPNCLLFHLKIIELWDWDGFDEELWMMKYFLENSRVLEKLVVHPKYLTDPKKLDAISKELRMLPRPSECQIELSKICYGT